MYVSSKNLLDDTSFRTSKKVWRRIHISLAPLFLSICICNCWSRGGRDMMAIHKATHQMLVPVWPDTKTHLYIHLHRSQLVGIFVFLPLQHAPYSQWDMTSITGTFVLKDMPHRIHIWGKSRNLIPKFGPNFCLILYFHSDFTPFSISVCLQFSSLYTYVAYISNPDRCQEVYWL